MITRITLGLALTPLWLLPLHASAAVFSDVSSDSQYASAILSVRERGIVQGYSDGTYRPTGAINRAEFTKIIMAAVGGGTCDETEQFSDVPASEWFFQSVCSARTLNVVSGYPDGTFKPQQFVNIAEAAKIVSIAFGFETEESDPWYETYMNALMIRNALPPSATDADRSLTRGEMAYIIAALIADKKELSGSSAAMSWVSSEESSASSTPVVLDIPADAYQFPLASNGCVAWSQTNEDGEANILNLTCGESGTTVLLELTEDRTFNGGWDQHDASFDIRWMDDSTIKTAVFDQRKKERPYGAPFLEYKMVKTTTNGQ